ncbi:hypothetical protein [Streptomyces sp. F001]|uniref:hypothetical protein n=1 Tax=Streptomyces sp. F001 TaxID=1510026 RepID=UPI00101E62BF|nr:hypothetical protein [Streptomyces sp. F001]
MTSTKPAGSDPAPRPKRRAFSAEYKLRIVAKYDAAPKNEKGAVLCRGRLYHSHVKERRAARDAGALEKLVDQRTSPARPKKSAAEAENEKLRRQVGLWRRNWRGTRPRWRSWSPPARSRRSKPVVALWGGDADPDTGVHGRGTPLQLVYSAAKRGTATAGVGPGSPAAAGMTGYSAGGAVVRGHCDDRDRRRRRRRGVHIRHRQPRQTVPGLDPRLADLRAVCLGRP